MSKKATSKGNELPILNLRGKDYLQVAHRLLWLNDDVENFTIATGSMGQDFEEGWYVARAEIRLLNDKGECFKSATGTKREDKSHFADYIEKAETGAIGRALAMLGFGTQFTADELEEGDRLADAPLPSPKKVSKAKTARKTASFKRPAAKKEVSESNGKSQGNSNGSAKSTDADGWE